MEVTAVVTKLLLAGDSVGQADRVATGPATTPRCASANTHSSIRKTLPPRAPSNGPGGWRLSAKDRVPHKRARGRASAPAPQANAPTPHSSAPCCGKRSAHSGGGWDHTLASASCK